MLRNAFWVIGWLMILGATLLLPPNAAAGPANSGSEPLSSLRILVELAEEESDPVSVAVTIRPLDAGSEVPARRIETKAPGEVRVDLPEGSRWLADIEAEGYWSKSREVEVDAPENVHEFVLFPAGAIAARIRLPPGGPVPKRMALRFLPSPEEDSRLPQGTQDCDLDDRDFLCRLPSGTFDLRVAADSYVPLYFWATEIPLHATKRLGTYQLVDGASVLGWIAVPSRHFDYLQARIDLEPLIEGVSRPTSGHRLETARREVGIDERGFFQFRGVRPGRYRLTADHPDYSATRLEVEVADQQEVELAPIELSTPASLDLVIEYPTDPYRQPWAVELTRASSERQRYETVPLPEASLEGRVLAEALSPGTYTLEVKDSRGGRWHAESIQLFSGRNRHKVRIGFERLEGTLLFEEEPVVGARVVLREHRGNARQVLKSREGGKFYAFLRRDSLWDIEVSHDELAILTSFSEVAVPEVDEGERYPRKTFEIPSTRIFGEVVDHQGLPIARSVMLDVKPFGAPEQSRLVVDGEFELRGLPPGGVRLVARTVGESDGVSARSAPLSLTLVEERAEGPVQLLLEDMQILEGQVYSPSDQPIVGAQIIAHMAHRHGAALTTTLPKETTDLDGNFRIELTASAEEAHLTVFPPGFAVTQQVVQLEGPRSTTLIPVDASAATLRVRYEDPPAEWLSAYDLLRQHTVIFLPHGIPPHYLSRWAASLAPSEETPNQWVIPKLRPGPVTVCFGFRSLVGLLASGAQPSPAIILERCVEGELPPGGALDANIPSEWIEREFQSEVEGVE